MTLRALLCGSFDADEREAWWRELRAAAPEVEWARDDGSFDRASVDVAVVANPPRGALAGLPRLRLVQSLWAGVDRLLDDPTVPRDVPLARMVDPAMTAAMAETAVWAVIALQRDFFDYAVQQARGEWRQHRQRRADEVHVRVLGAGQMGGEAAARLSALDFRVSTWRSSDALPPWHGAPSIVLNLLPLTPATRGLLDARCFAALPPGASIVNLARGAHLVDADLLDALDRGHLHRAVLDVFQAEPLAPDHPYWRHPRVTVLPHVAAQTDERTAARVVAGNLQRLARGEPLAHLVDRVRGY